jgi:hypothetical protein
MAQYKVIQDIEAEDKILGPLTLRQFIYGLISAFFLYICFLLITKGVAFMVIFFLPPALFTGFFAFPFGKDQSTEVWALAKIRFLIKPRKRIWDQSGVKDLVTITVPKRIERVLTDGLSQTEVQSRLQALANTIDSRGWAVKNVNVNLYSQPSPLVADTSDRLIDINSMPRDVPNIDVQAADDIMDEHSNPIAHQFEQMIEASALNHRKQLVNELNDIRAEEKAKATGQPNDYWFMHQAPAPTNLPADQTIFNASPVVHPGGQDITVAAPESVEEHQLAEKIKTEHETHKITYPHLRTIQPLKAEVVEKPEPAHLNTPRIGLDQTIFKDPSAVIPAGASSVSQVAAQYSSSKVQAPITDTTQPAQTADLQTVQAVTPPHNAAIMNLANNNDLNVSTLAREANKANGSVQASDGEVVISLR